MTSLADLEARYLKLIQALTSTKAIVFDIDGVLTDGSLLYGEHGECIKRFHVRDGVGFKLLTDFGCKLGVVSAKNSAMNAQRMSELGVQDYVPGAKDKLAEVRSLANKWQLSLDEIAFVGDDMVDLTVMQHVAVGICPKDAYFLVAQQSEYKVDVSGGQGVARLVADLWLLSQNQFKSAYQLATTPDFERKR